MCPPLVCPSLVSIQAIIPTQEKITKKQTNRGRQQTANWLTIPIHKFPGAQVVDQIVFRQEYQWALYWFPVCWWLFVIIVSGCLLFPCHVYSTDQDIDNNNCIQEYRQFHVDISAVCTWIHPHYAYSRQWIAYLIKQISFFSWPQPCHDVWTHKHLVTILICPTK